MRLFHERWGSGPDVVLVHAGVCDSRMWEPQRSALTAAFTTLRYDMRGFGRSPLAPEPFSHARDLLSLLDRLSVERAALVGASFGGRIALEVAVVRPELVSALVLLDAALPDHDSSKELEAFAAEEEAALVRGDLDAAVEVNVRTWVDAGRGAGEVDRTVREQVAGMQRRAFELQLATGDEAEEEEPLVPDLGARLAEIAAPTLVVVGEHDLRDFQEIAERLRDGILGARLERVPGAAHLPSLERPDEVNALLLAFLAARVQA